MNVESTDYKTLEVVSISQSNQLKRSNIATKLGRILNQIIQLIGAVNEPKINLLKSQTGPGYQVIYDPILGHIVCFDSTTAVRE